MSIYLSTTKCLFQTTIFSLYCVYSVFNLILSTVLNPTYMSIIICTAITASPQKNYKKTSKQLSATTYLANNMFLKIVKEGIQNIYHVNSRRSTCYLCYDPFPFRSFFYPISTLHVPSSTPIMFFQIFQYFSLQNVPNAPKVNTDRSCLY